MTDVHDPYGGCEDDCTHDLARGATAEELRDGDGPYPDTNLIDGAGRRLAEAIAASTRQSSRVQT